MTDRPETWPRLAVILILLATATLALRPVPTLFDLPIEEDGYMVLTNARHMARGEGVSYDGYTLNNGFQPLWVFLNAPLYRLVDHDPEKMVRATFALHWLFFLGTLGLIGVISRDAVPSADADQRRLLFWLGCLLYGGALADWQKQFNGLETSCALFFYALAWRYHQSGRTATLRGTVGFGALLGLLVLARIDSVFLVILLALQRLLPRDDEPWRQRLHAAVTTGGVAFLVSLPWWAYNVIQFGHLTPASGLGLREWGWVPKRLYMGIDAAASMLTPHYYDKDFIDHSLLGGRVLLALRLLALLALIVYLWRQRRRLGWGSGMTTTDPVSASRQAMARRTWTFALAFGLAMGVLLAWYVVSSWAWFFYERYFAPWLLLAAPAYVALVFLLAQRWQSLPKRVAQLLALLIVGISLAAYVGTPVKHNIMFQDMLPLVKKNVPDAEWVALAQSGTVGYFRDRVVNLAGVSNMTAIAYQDHMWDYLDREGINWFCDWPDYVKSLLGNKVADGTWVLVDERGLFQLYRRKVPLERRLPARGT
ncbi:MAG: hypothetical protein HQL66_10395 [Magnetococcales bacterium]|nr:hypothetical protein [Magnetococcales bacterium]